MSKAIDAFFEWLHVEAKGRQVGGYIIFAALISISVTYTLEAALENWGLIPAREIPKPDETPFKYVNTFILISMFVWAPVKEEIIFRLIPLGAVVKFISESPKVVFGILVAFSLLFGAIHPYGWMGRIDVAITGFCLGLLFLKCGGLNKALFKASVCTMVAHGLCNVLVVFEGWWRYFEFTR